MSDRSLNPMRSLNKFIEIEISNQEPGVRTRFVYSDRKNSFLTANKKNIFIGQLSQL
ncbi:hypothetical protein COO91_10942 (plasmid) [Nostoc flagelliforme CCNUN1]|uniref:Uncharacterized protein n=1 Tax=Nostoc flagelliforme CCNUN1 TaxID=2038116 RepID=A0A2K8TAL2_9NOSO|nr:hypothetical protein [Nostoc flagelliforme]AUB44702.1 hypothetical protein COO91_10942 [Nostoc flagelliforme CCNUN1]